MRVAVRMVVVGVCLSCVALLGACGSKSAGTVTPTPSPSKTLTMQVRAAAYFESLTPVFNADQALSAKLTKVQALVGAGNAFSLASRIDSEYLPAVEQMQARLAAIRPPSGFRVAHAHLVELCAIEGDFLSFMHDALLQAVHTHSLEPGFTSEGNRYVARCNKAVREYGIAVRAAAKRAHVKVPARLLPGTLLT